MTLCVKKKSFPNSLICLFLIGSASIGKNITSKLIIQGLLWIYNKYISSNLTKIKALLMASTSKTTFNIHGLTIHSTLNIHVQQLGYLIYQTY
jgi:hypothetical protein